MNHGHCNFSSLLGQAWKAVEADSADEAKAQYIVLVTLVHPQWASGAAAKGDATQSKPKGLGPVTSTMVQRRVRDL